MTGIAFLAAVIAMLWLGHWLIQGKRSDRKPKPARRNKLRWSPFEYRIQEVTEAEPAEQPQLPEWRSRAAAGRRPR